MGVLEIDYMLEVLFHCFWDCSAFSHGVGIICFKLILDSEREYLGW